MKVRMELELDLSTGVYDIRLHNISHPGESIDVHKLNEVVHRVLEDVAQRTEDEVATPAKWSKGGVN